MKSVTSRCTTVQMPLLSVKRMVERGHFIGFCAQGGFILDTSTGNVEWLREEGGNYLLDGWLVPHDKAEKLKEVAANNQSFHRPS